mmetsp:Transcript_39625/g.45274  ORF Transcript_39625/g.45274 Transcript_39625/m.45274 type:complete len:113 (-) Transcript_39625:30-368(-)
MIPHSSTASNFSPTQFVAIGPDLGHGGIASARQGIFLYGYDTINLSPLSCHMKDVTHPSVIHIEHPPPQGVEYLFLDNNKEGAAHQYERKKEEEIMMCGCIIRGNEHHHPPV